METHIPPSLSGHTGVALNPASTNSRRILVLKDDLASGTETQANLCFAPYLRAFRVDYRDVQSLGLDQGSNVPTLARMTCAREDDDRMASLSMLGKYQLILVPNDRIRVMLCTAMPGLAHHVYALDCFGQAGSGEEPFPSGSPQHARQLDAELGHWSTFLSHLSC